MLLLTHVRLYDYARGHGGPLHRQCVLCKPVKDIYNLLDSVSMEFLSCFEQYAAAWGFIMQHVL